MTKYAVLIGFGILVLAYRAFWFFLRKYIVSRTTALEDLDAIGQTRAHAKLRGTAVICGGR